MVACIATLLSLNSQAQEIAHGALDKSFRPTLDGNVFVVLPNSDGAIMVGGSFANAGYNDEDAVYMGNIIRLNSNGNPDKSFNTGGIGFDNSVYSILRTPEGKYLVSGRFSKYNDQPVGMLVRLMPDGSLDPTFNNQYVYSRWLSRQLHPLCKQDFHSPLRTDLRSRRLQQSERYICPLCGALLGRWAARWQLSTCR